MANSRTTLRSRSIWSISVLVAVVSLPLFFLTQNHPDIVLAPFLLGVSLIVLETATEGILKRFWDSLKVAFLEKIIGTLNTSLWRIKDTSLGEPLVPLWNFSKFEPSSNEIALANIKKYLSESPDEANEELDKLKFELNQMQIERVRLKLEIAQLEKSLSIKIVSMAKTGKTKSIQQLKPD